MDASTNAALPASTVVAQLTQFQEAVGIVTWIWDLGDALAVWHGDLSPMLGLQAGAFGGTFSDSCGACTPMTWRRRGPVSSTA